jgi:hypothetical protein
LFVLDFLFFPVLTKMALLHKGSLATQLLLLMLVHAALYTNSDTYAASIAHYIKTDQTLPNECISLLTQLDFPSRNDLVNPEDWGKLNSVCCAAFPSTALHMQRKTLPDGSEIPFPACLQEVEVPEAFELFVNSSNQPQGNLISCKAGWYNGHPSTSTYAVVPDCTSRKSNCNDAGQELFCKGGPSANDLCTCSAGFEPKGPDCSSLGFDSNGLCSCLPI